MGLDSKGWLILRHVLLLAGCLIVLRAHATFAGASLAPNLWTQAVQWLVDQQVPNDTVSTPADCCDGLVLSYRLPQTDPEYDDSWIYDDALAAIAWSMEGNCPAAEPTLSALAGLMDADGKLSFAYNTMSGEVANESYRTGAIAWVGYAFVFYQKTCGDNRFQAAAERMADWVLTMRVSVVDSVKGGPDVSWLATEHAIDAFFFLRDIGLLTNNTTYLDAAYQLKQSLLLYYWNDAYGCFNEGIWDTARALDSASWGALFLLSIGETQKAQNCLDHLETNFATTATCVIGGVSQPIQGYQPYADTDLVWSEGSLGVALAYRRAGQQAKYDAILNEIGKMQGADGGLVYACPGIPDQFSDAESVAGTTWMVMLQSANENKFWEVGLLPDRPIPKTSQHTQVKVPGPSNVSVNTWNGNLYYPISLLSIPGRGPGIELALNYNSLWHKTGSDFGLGWQLSYNIYYLQAPNSDMIIAWGDGSTDHFVKKGDAFDPPVGIYDTLQEYQPDKFVLRTKHGMTFYFDSPLHKRLTRMQDPNGNALTFTYDDRLSLSGITDATGRQVNLAYTGGNLTTVTDPNGRSIQLQHDAAGNLSRITDPLGNATTYGYDAGHLLISITPPRGAPTTISYTRDVVTNVAGELVTKSFTYHTANRTTTMTDSAPEGDQTARFTYDADGRIITMEDPLGHVVSAAWDGNNNLTALADENGNISTYAYNNRGNLLSVNDPAGGTTTYTYEITFNKLTSLTDANGHTTHYGYDAQGNLVSETDPLGYITSYSYNNLGELTARTDANGATTTYSYDTHGNLITVTDPQGGVTNYSYDVIGNMTSAANAHVNVLYIYDALNRVTNINYVSLGKSTSYTYDAAGNRATMIDPDGGVTIYTYDNANRLTVLTNPLGQTTGYQYDGYGRLTRKTYHNGTYATYHYDQAGRLDILTNNKSSDQVISRYTYAYDNAGNRTSMTEANGDVTGYTYDDLYRLTGVTYPDGSMVEYAYDAAGNRLTLTDTGGATSYAYDATDRLQNAGAASYGWDNNGNMTSKTDQNGTTTYAYDHENRLISVTLPNGSTNTFTYYPDGRRLSQTNISGQTTTYLYDGLNTLAEINNSGTATARYTSAGIDGWISMERGGATHYYHQDGLGSITGLSDAGQNLAATYQYDVFGAIRSKTGTVANPYLFTGRRWDEENSLYDYRFRQYEPTLGRFTTKDPWRANLSKPATLHEYTFVNNNPAKFVDPLGLQLELVKLGDSFSLLPESIVIPILPPIPIPIPGVDLPPGVAFPPNWPIDDGESPTDPPPVTPGPPSGAESEPPRPVAVTTQLVRAFRPSQQAFTLEEVLPLKGPAGTEPIFVTPTYPLAFANASEARAVDFRPEPDYEATAIAAVLVTKTLGETYWHDYAVCSRFRGYTLDDLEPLSIPGLAGSTGEAYPFWHSSAHTAGFFEEALTFAVFVNESAKTFTVDSRWIRSQYACHWRAPSSQPFDYVLNYQVWSSSLLETYRLLHSTFDRLAAVGNGWTITFTDNTELLTPTVIMNSAKFEYGSIKANVHSFLPEPRLVLFQGTKQLCQGCEDIPFQFWEVINPGSNAIELPLGNVSNAVVFSEADGFLDKVFVDRDVSGAVGTHATYLPIILKKFDGSQPPPPTPEEPGISIAWPPEGAAVTVEQDLTGEANDYRLTVHGTVQGMKPGWTISVEVFTDTWYPQDAATVRDGLWGARVRLSGQGVYNNHRIRVTLLDASGTQRASDMVSGIVRVNPCQTP